MRRIISAAGYTQAEWFRLFAANLLLLEADLLRGITIGIHETSLEDALKPVRRLVGRNLGTLAWIKHSTRNRRTPYHVWNGDSDWYYVSLLKHLQKFRGAPDRLANDRWLGEFCGFPLSCVDAWVRDRKKGLDPVRRFLSEPGSDRFKIKPNGRSSFTPHSVVMFVPCSVSCEEAKAFCRRSRRVLSRFPQLRPDQIVPNVS